MSVELKIKLKSLKSHMGANRKNHEDVQNVGIHVTTKLFLNTKANALSTFKSTFQKQTKEIIKSDIKIKPNVIECIHAFITSDLVQHYRNSQNGVALCHAFSSLFKYLFETQKSTYSKTEPIWFEEFGLAHPNRQPIKFYTYILDKKDIDKFSIINYYKKEEIESVIKNIELFNYSHKYLVYNPNTNGHFCISFNTPPAIQDMIDKKEEHHIYFYRDIINRKCYYLTFIHIL